MKPLTSSLAVTPSSACWPPGATSRDPAQYGPDPKLPEPQRGLLPDMKIANPAEWGERRPTAPQGYTVAPIATGLKIPRQTLVLPNGDILVAEGRGGAAPTLTPKDFIAGIIKAQGHEPGRGRQPPDPAARQRWRRHLRRSARSSPTISTRPTGSRWSATSSTSPTRMRWSASTTVTDRPGRAARRSRSRTCRRRSTITGPRRWRRAPTAVSSMSASDPTATSPSAAWWPRSTGRGSGRSMPRPARTGPSPPACAIPPRWPSSPARVSSGRW